MVLNSSGQLRFETEGFRLHITEFDARNIYNINPVQIFPATFIAQRLKFEFQLRNMVLNDPGGRKLLNK